MAENESRKAEKAKNSVIQAIRDGLAANAKGREYNPVEALFFRDDPAGEYVNVSGGTLWTGDILLTDGQPPCYRAFLSYTYPGRAALRIMQDVGKAVKGEVESKTTFLEGLRAVHDSYTAQIFGECYLCEGIEPTPAEDHREVGLGKGAPIKGNRMAALVYDLLPDIEEFFRGMNETLPQEKEKRFAGYFEYCYYALRLYFRNLSMKQKPLKTKDEQLEFDSRDAYSTLEFTPAPEMTYIIVEYETASQLLIYHIDPEKQSMESPKEYLHLRNSLLESEDLRRQLVEERPELNKYMQRWERSVKAYCKLLEETIADGRQVFDRDLKSREPE